MRSPDKRSRLLSAALELFQSRGFDNVAVPEVAQAAGVATGTIYRHFKDKQALGNGLYRAWRNTYSGFVLEPAPPGTPPREEFAAKPAAAPKVLDRLDIDPSPARRACLPVAPSDSRSGATVPSVGSRCFLAPSTDGARAAISGHSPA